MGQPRALRATDSGDAPVGRGWATAEDDWKANTTTKLVSVFPPDWKLGWGSHCMGQPRALRATDSGGAPVGRGWAAAEDDWKANTTTKLVSVFPPDWKLGWGSHCMGQPRALRATDSGGARVGRGGLRLRTFAKRSDRDEMRRWLAAMRGQLARTGAAEPAGRTGEPPSGRWMAPIGRRPMDGCAAGGWCMVTISATAGALPLHR